MRAVARELLPLRDSQDELLDTAHVSTQRTVKEVGRLTRPALGEQDRRPAPFLDGPIAEPREQRDRHKYAGCQGRGDRVAGKSSACHAD